MIRLALLALLVSGCKSKSARSHDASVAARDDAGKSDASTRWDELATSPSIEPVRVIAVPSRPTAPRFDAFGPVLAGDLAVVSSSQFGFAAVDFRRGQVAWTKPAGAHVAPPQVVDGNIILIGDCINPPDVPESELLLGCARVVTQAAADVAYVAIRGKRAGVSDFAGATGPQRVWPAATSGIVWRRGDSAIAIDLMTGLATPAPADDPPLVVSYKKKTWNIRRTEEGIIDAGSWKTEQSYGTLIGAVYLPEQSPMVRVANATMHNSRPEILLFDIDATGSLNGQVSMNPVPGIAVTAHAIDAVGNAALAVRLDKTLRHDFIAGYAANALLMWTYQLPDVPRPDPIGIAIAHDAVVVFHDGDTVTVLPQLSAPPTAPGAVEAPSENATP